MVIKSPYADAHIPDVDIWDMYFKLPPPYADNQELFISGETGRSYTYADIRDRSIAFGQGLKYQHRWAKGDVCAFFTPNDIDTVAVVLGVHWAGGVASPANPTYTPEELARQMSDSGARLLVTQKAFLPAAQRAVQIAGMPADSILLLGEERDPAGKLRHWTDVTASAAWIKPTKTPIDPKKDLAYLVYSSGTTGLPKGVMLTHTNIVANSYQSRNMDLCSLHWDLDGQLGMLPLFHIYGLSVVVNATLVTGAKCLLMAKFDLERACQLVQDHRLTFLYVPPPVVLAFGKHPAVSKYDITSIRWINSGAAPLGKELVEAVWNRHRIPVKQGYGLSETSPSTHTQAPDEFLKFQGSVGRLYPNMEAKIVDPDGNELPQGEQGELLLRGPNVFHGYWKKQDTNNEVFTEDGFFKTGDVFYVCPKGNFYCTDRIKELIKYKGFQVPPAELEGKLLGRDDVADACVLGVWNAEQHTEVPRAYIVVKAGVQETDALKKDIVDWLSARVGPPKRLRGGVEFVKEVPKSASGKILRRLLRDKLKKEEAAPRARL